ncbi:MAG: lasso peptide biosynthesis B2 protein [Chloroflexota bacterium]
MLLLADFRKLSSRSLLELFLFSQAFFWLLVMQLGIAFFHFQDIARWIGLKTDVSTSPPAPVGGQFPVSKQIAWAISASARRTPWISTCLAQALACAILLRGWHIPGLVYLGLAKDASSKGGYAAHAWLRCGDAILTGASGHERFQVIAVFRTAKA